MNSLIPLMPFINSSPKTVPPTNIELLKATGTVTYWDERYAVNNGLPTNNPLTNSWADLIGTNNIPCASLDVGAHILTDTFKPYCKLDKTGDAIRFAGAAPNVPANLNFLNPPFAIAMTVYIDQAVYTTNGWFLNLCDNDTTNTQYGMYYNLATKSFSVYLNGASRATSANNSLNVTGFKQIGFLCDGVKVYLYIDGEEVTNANYNTFPLTARGDFRLNNRSGSATYLGIGFANMFLASGVKCTRDNFVKAMRAIMFPFVSTISNKTEETMQLANPYRGYSVNAKTSFITITDKGNNGNDYMWIDGGTLVNTAVGRVLKWYNNDGTYRGSGTLISTDNGGYRVFYNLTDGQHPVGYQQKLFRHSNEDYLTLCEFRISWRELEPTKGVIDWTTIESSRMFNYWRNRGAKCIFRLYTDWPQSAITKNIQIPDWLYTQMGGDLGYFDLNGYNDTYIQDVGIWYSNALSGYGNGFMPDFNSSVLKAEHERLINLIAERYKNDNFFFIFQIGSVGHWGECHYASNIHWNKMAFPTNDSFGDYVHHYVNAFAGSDKFLTCRYAKQPIVDHNLGLYNDSMGSWNQQELWFEERMKAPYNDDYLYPQPAYPEWYYKAPFGGEPPPSPSAQQQFSDVDEPVEGTGMTEWQGLQYMSNATSCRVSWLSVAPDIGSLAPGNQTYVDTFQKTIGYRFFCKQLDHNTKVYRGCNLNFRLNLSNTGYSKFFYPWKIEVSLVNGGGTVVAKKKLSYDLRNALPGDTKIIDLIEISSSLPVGAYTLCVAIVNPATSNPEVKLANANVRADGRYPISTVTIV